MRNAQLSYNHLNYLDRTNIGNAYPGGMGTDLNLTSSDYSLVLSIFFVGYLLWEVPSNMMLAHSTPRVFLPTIMFIWGAMSIGAKGIHNLGGMVAFRFVLGLVEAGFFPGVMLLMSCWYKPAELSKRVAIFYTAALMAGAFGGILAGLIIEGLEGKAGTRGWKWLFIIEGLITVFFASIAFFVLPNYPATTKWLTEEERELAINRLRVGAGADAPEEHVSHFQAFKDACKDPKTWVFVVVYNLINGAGTISYFFPTLMKTLGYTGRKIQFMTVPIYAVSLVISVTGGIIADKTRQKAFVVLGAALLSTVSFIIITAVKNSKVRYAFLCFGGAGIWTAVPVFLSWMVTMFDGREKRAVSIALVNGFGNLASVYGSFLWDKKYAPGYLPGFATTTALCGCIAIVVTFARFMWGDKGVAKTS
ncbi:MFS transporter prlL [Vanrija pseudolonga]|uniref:MFS transporter prlL n=1 Tax=Vanrija pseudolonga TaxID=143232 RepID=A0AAF0YCZ9_9TREE|nr:MFS transporter prlL [Vanrija pseudolonga]